MPKRGKTVKVERISGRQLFNFSSGSAVTIPLQPSSFNRALAIADVFQFYRFVKCRVRCLPANLGDSFVIGYAPGAAFDTPPTTTTQIIEFPVAVAHGRAKSVDTIMDIPRKELVNDAQLSWFKTIAGTPDAQFEIQGNLYGLISTGVATPISVVIEYTIEFQSWNLAAQSPLVPLTASAQQQSTGVVSKKQKEVLMDERNQGFVVIDGVTYTKSLA